MIRRLFLTASFALAALTFASDQAFGQAQGLISGYGVNYGDTVSPYLNLLSAGAGGGLGTYQNLVDPIIQGRQANQANAAGINQLQSQINGGGGSRRGNQSIQRHYMNYSHYYLGIRK